MRRDAGQGDRLVHVGGNIRTCPPDLGDAGRRSGASPGSTAPAFAEPGDLRRVRSRKEQHAVLPRAPAGTTWPAVNFRGSHSVYEPAVSARVACDDRPPSDIV